MRREVCYPHSERLSIQHFAPASIGEMFARLLHREGIRLSRLADSAWGVFPVRSCLDRSRFTLSDC